jgi:predicted Fe-Mo cluster-binding NifX family protein/predicted DNA-binding protein (UPF0251 family)
MSDLAELYLSVDGFEALRLADYEGLSHEEAALRMHISRQTFGRILAQAHRVVAKSLVYGLALRIHGGDYRVADPAVAGDGADAREGLFGVGADKTKKGGSPMETIAVTCEGPGLDEPVDSRFGRAAGFLLVDPDTLRFTYVENGAAQARAQGAGIQAAETVARAGAKIVLTGYVGPKAYQALEAAGIRVVQDLDKGTVRQALERFRQSEPEWTTAESARGPQS